MTADTKPASSQRITPYLYYENVAGTLEWLTAAFGCRELTEQTMRAPEGNVLHTAVEIGGGVVMMGRPSLEYRNPKRTGQVTQNLYVYVEDLDSHFQHAKAAGAKILSEPEDTFYGDRRYGAEDCEGHHWFFAERVEARAPKDWHPSAEDLKGHA